jgi:thiol-disulfide isomerase/thioredoxin
MSPTAPPESLLVACLCAQWCGVCRDYQSRFEQVKTAVQADIAQSQFLWVDVEDEADLLHPLDVEDFPTLLIALGGKPYFFGPLTPQAQTLERMIRATAQDPTAPGLTDPALALLVKKIQGLG